MDLVFDLLKETLEKGDKIKISGSETSWSGKNDRARDGIRRRGMKFKLRPGAC